MEKERKISESGHAAMQALSAKLKEAGVFEGSDVYYEDENFADPFMKIPKAYKKENENDPDVHYIFVDVGEGPAGMEYTVTANFVHEHIPGAADAATLINGLLTGEIVELALVYEDMKVSFYMKNTGDHEKNVQYLAGDKETADYVLEHMNNPMVQAGQVHQHLIFPKNYPYSLMYENAGRHVLPGVKVYVVSAIFGEHPEYYVMA